MAKKYILYLIRWQLSTPILWLVLVWLTELPAIAATVIANLIGGLIFFWVDRFIFRTIYPKPLWEIEEDTVCADCGAHGKGYRITEWLGYNRRKDKAPEFRCETCKDAKMNEVSNRIKKKK